MLGAQNKPGCSCPLWRLLLNLECVRLGRFLGAPKECRSFDYLGNFRTARSSCGGCAWCDCTNVIPRLLTSVAPAGTPQEIGGPSGLGLGLQSTRAPSLPLITEPVYSIGFSLGLCEAVLVTLLQHTWLKINNVGRSVLLFPKNPFLSFRLLLAYVHFHPCVLRHVDRKGSFRKG